MRNSWLNVTGESIKQPKISKKEEKEIAQQRELSFMNNKLSYLNVIPKANTHFD